MLQFSEVSVLVGMIGSCPTLDSLQTENRHNNYTLK